LLLAEHPEQLQKAYELALEEVKSRPTAQSYDLLAWTLYKKGDYKTALKMAEMYVVNKTFEPEALFHLAKIYRANNLNEKAAELRKELLESTYELGPLMEQEIVQL
jgi:tetratricopeptide (TPR) repeat protein